MNEPSELERRTRELLDESVEALDARTRSRLTRARQAAIDSASAAGGARSGAWTLWAPVGGLVAAAVLAVMFWPRAGVIEPVPHVLAPPGAPQVADDLELILGEDPFDFTGDEDVLLGT